MNNSDHIAKQLKKRQRNKRSLKLLSLVLVASSAAVLAILTPPPPENILHSLNANHQFYYHDDLRATSAGHGKFNSSILNGDGTEFASVKTYFMHDQADIIDLIKQFYSEYFEIGESSVINPTYQFQDTYISVKLHDSTALVYSYPKESFKKIQEFNFTANDDSVRSGEYRNFTPNEYRDILDHIVYRGLELPSESPVIVGENMVDEYIATTASRRGYEQRRIGEPEDLAKYEGIPINEAARGDLSDLVAAANRDGHSIGVLSGYRSVEVQADLFKNRYSGSVDASSVAAGGSDVEINKVLETTAPPTMSKHHSGYTVDLAESGVYYTRFKDTESFKWLSADNYKNAKRFGFVPSYPENAEDQGPNPEAWEYTYVGKNILTK